MRECSGRFGRVSGSPRAGRTRSEAPDAEDQLWERPSIGTRRGEAPGCSSVRCGRRPMAAPGRTRSGAPDSELYASPRTNPLALDVENHRPVRRVVVDGVQWPPQVELGQEHLTPRSTLRRGPIMGAPIHWYSTWGTTSRLSGHRPGGHFLEEPEQHSVSST